MKRYNLLGLALLMVMVSCGPGVAPSPSETAQAPTTGTIAGQVIDASSGAPIGGANVTTDPPTSSLTTAADGSYSITYVNPDRYVVVASKGGYTSESVEIAVTPGKTTTADIQLVSAQTATLPPTPTAVATQPGALEPVEVSALCQVYGQSPAKVEHDRPIILSWQWTAAKPELIQEHLGAAVYQILLDGKVIKPSKVSDVKFVYEKSAYQITWTTDPMVLDIGTHVTERNVSWTRQISDGWHTYGPGGTYETLHDTCTIIVE